MNRTYTKELREHIGKEVRLKGWVHRVRDLGAISFLVLRDFTGLAQVVSDKIDVKLETVVDIVGKVVENEKSPEGVELQMYSLTILSEPQADLPISVNSNHEIYGMDVLLNKRILSLRNPKLRSVFEIQSGILEAFATVLREKSFFEIKSSKLINSGTEGGTGLFEVNYFNTKVFLSQSPQFYKQAAVSMGLEKVFEIGAAYRAEKHETNRHLNEYISLDLELGFIDDIRVLFDLERDILAAVFQTLKQKYQKQLDIWSVELPDPDSVSSIPELSYEEAKDIAKSTSGTQVMEIDGNAEKILSEWAKEKFGISAVFIYGYPRRKRPFYTMPDGNKTKSFDCIFNGVEITSGGLRIHDYQMLCDNAKRFGMDLAPLEDYLSIFQFACPPHGGFAIGLERLTQKILGIDNVKLASLFPRDRNRVSP